MWVWVGGEEDAGTTEQVLQPKSEKTHREGTADSSSALAISPRYTGIRLEVDPAVLRHFECRDPRLELGNDWSFDSLQIMVAAKRHRNPDSGVAAPRPAKAKALGSNEGLRGRYYAGDCAACGKADDAPCKFETLRHR